MREFAHVWPRGGLFAFSGVDGETCHAEPFVASGTTDGIGWDFWLKPKMARKAYAGDTRLDSENRPEDFCFCDCWRCTTRVGEADGLVYGAFLDRSTMAVAFEFEQLEKAGAPRLEIGVDCRRDGDVSVVAGSGWWLAICEDAPGPVRQIGVAISYHEEQDAIERARGAQAAGLPDITSRRLSFYESLSIPETLWGNLRRTYYKAASVHKVNIESAQLDIPCRWTTPDRMPHRHMWLWDSAFHSLGLMHIKPDLSRDAIRALLAKQRDDGKLLLAAQPGVPEREESNTQPPIVAWAVWRHYHHSGDPGLLKEFYPGLVRYVGWFEKNRRNDDGLYGWTVRSSDDPIKDARGGESGMDNSPRFDSVKRMTAVDLCGYMASEYAALEQMAQVLEFKTDESEWHNRHQEIAARINERLWDDEDRFYYDLDEQGHFIPVKTPAGLMPMLGGVPDRDRAEMLRVHVLDNHEFWSPFPVASVSQDEETYSSDMWRGPAWPNMNVLVYYCLQAYGFYEEGQKIAHRTIEEISRWYLRTGCFYEYYDSQTTTPPPELPRKGAPGKRGGVGFGVVPDLQWTAAAYVHFGHLIA